MVEFRNWKSEVDRCTLTDMKLPLRFDASQQGLCEEWFEFYCYISLRKFVPIKKAFEEARHLHILNLTAGLSIKTLSYDSEKSMDDIQLELEKFSLILI